MTSQLLSRSTSTSVIITTNNCQTQCQLLANGLQLLANGLQLLANGLHHVLMIFQVVWFQLSNGFNHVLLIFQGVQLLVSNVLMILQVVQIKIAQSPYSLFILQI